jgi:threonine/homoserine/homoserine lactone efflux protein
MVNFASLEMQSLHQLWLPVSTFALVTSASPGPVNIIAVSSGLRFGVRNTLPQVLGATLGFSLLLLAVGMGLGQVLAASAWLLAGLKMVGSVFLCYMAWTLLFSRDQVSDLALSKPPSFWEGLLSQWVNPKAWVVAAAGISSYSLPGTAYGMSVVFMALTFALVCFPSIAAWAILGASATSVLGSPRLIHRFNMGMALLLLLSVFSLYA